MGPNRPEDLPRALIGNQAGLILIMGPPASGKSALGRRLAEILGGHCFSLGDLIRADWRRDTTHGRPQIEAAIAGKCLFPAEYLAGLISHALGSLQGAPGPVIFDAGPPVDEALAQLSLRPMQVLWLAADSDTRRARFLNRARNEVVAGAATASLFAARDSLYAKHLPQMGRTLSAIAPLTIIDANADAEEVVLQACEALLNARAGDDPEFCFVAGANSADLPEQIAAAASEPSPSLWLSPDTTGGNLVALVKPGATRIAFAFLVLRKTLEDAGYGVSAVAVWPGGCLRRTGRAEAHCGRHYLFAALPSLVGHVGDNPNAPTIGTAFKIAYHDGPEALDRLWTSDPRPVRRGTGLWTKACGSDVLINGHIPPLLADFHDPHLATVAIMLESGFGALPLSALRRDILGGSDPDTAVPGSLRRAISTGELDFGITPRAHRNGFHLSASPVEALRESFVWFGEKVTHARFAKGRYADPGLHLALVDRPVSGRGAKTLFAAQENADYGHGLDGALVPDLLIRQAYLAK